LSLVANHRGEARDAERLARDCLDVVQKLDAQVVHGIGLRILGQALVLSGKYTEAHSLLEESRAVFRTLGARRRLFYYALPILSKVKMDLGLYEEARVLAQMGLEGAREMRNPRAIGRTLCIVGSVALAERMPAEAQRWLQESVAAYREAGVRDELGWVLGCLGYVSRALGQSDRARRHVCRALQIGSEIGAFFPSITALPAIALLLADQGEVERAVELYVLASRYPYVACSHWFEDVAGQQIAAIAATLPPEVIVAARERGRARDFEEAVKELLAELSEQAE
jgi:tetratricopeptide (TPR) repeat protein